jgi:serine/threonine protein kinase
MSKYGKWQTYKRIGGGGNGEVYRCRSGDGADAAIKLLRRDLRGRRDRMVRFRNEINFLISQGKRVGVLPLIDHHLPDDPAEPSWYVMPLADPMLKAFGTSPNLAEVVSAVAQVAETLAGLAAEDISHRDIKPDNLFKLNGAWAIGDFGLVKYPESEPITRQGRPVGPYLFMAPEMRQHADTASGELADVYSLAKTLWSLTVGRPDPPPGELRADRPALRLSAYVEVPRARLLDPILERCTSDEPEVRMSMREMADELKWWSDASPVKVQPDLSAYAAEAQRLNSIKPVKRVETDPERLVRLYNEAISVVQSTLTPLLTVAFAQAGLQHVFEKRPIFGWPPKDYGGGATLPCWGISTLASPWLAASIGAVHRSQPAPDLEDMGVTFILALMMPDSQYNYIDVFEKFRPGSIRLNQILDSLSSMTAMKLPVVVADFLTACRESGIPRQE